MRPRDMIGYGPPRRTSGGRGANIAVQFVLNYEEGAESIVLHGNPASETFLSEIVGAQPFPNWHMSTESLYECRSRAGLWRALRVFERRGQTLTIFGVAMALARSRRRSPRSCRAVTRSPVTALCWLSYQLVEPGVKRGLDRHVSSERSIDCVQHSPVACGTETETAVITARSPGALATEHRQN